MKQKMRVHKHAPANIIYNTHNAYTHETLKTAEGESVHTEKCEWKIQSKEKEERKKNTT